MFSPEGISGSIKQGLTDRSLPVRGSLTPDYRRAREGGTEQEVSCTASRVLNKDILGLTRLSKIYLRRWVNGRARNMLAGIR